VPSPLDALNYAKRLTGNLPIDDANLKYRVLNSAHNDLWMAAPWRWTVGDIDVVTLVNDTQDYNVTAKSDFLFLVHAWRTNGQEKTDLTISASLPSTSIIKGQTSQISYITGTPDKVRTLPVPTGYDAADLPKIVSIYKKKPTEIVVGNEANDYETTFGVPKVWFPVYEKLVLWHAYQFAFSPRSGTVTFAGGQVQYSGQAGVAMAAIQDMRTAEKKFLDSIGQVVTNNG
jgi:hypothetical protein